MAISNSKNHTINVKPDNCQLLLNNISQINQTCVSKFLISNTLVFHDTGRLKI